MTMRPLSFRPLFVLLLGCLLLASLPGCGGGRRLISKDQEISMGREAADQFERENGGRSADPAAVELVNRIAARLVPVTKPPDYPYDIRVLNNREINAVAFPGGRIYVFHGLIKHFDADPDKIAWVIGHEAAHVARQHAVRRVERQLGYEAIIALIFNKGDAPQIASAVAGLMLLDYGRDNELEADRYGLTYAHAAGYDPTAAIAVLQGFQELQKHKPSNLEIMFMTHPGEDTRINHVRDYLKSQGWHGAYYQP